MICVTIAQESRRLALADILNASMLGADMVEIRLDRFEKDANLGELVAAKRVPILFSCKRQEDGGNWTGTEQERMILLRAGVIAKADFIEIEWDCADQIRPFPGCKRVISYTNLKETPRDIEEIYNQIRAKKPDIIKLTCKANTPEEAWPLVKILSKPIIPTVVVGLGNLSVMMSLLGRKIGSPWTTAALEKGMEAFPGQPTIHDLVEVYRHRDIDKKTRFVAITGNTRREYIAADLLNTAFVTAQMPHRVMPTQVGNLKLFRKVADAVRFQGVMLDREFRMGLGEIASYDESSRSPVLAADSLFPKDEGWLASNTLGPAVADTLELISKEKDDREEPLKGRMVLLAGIGPLTRMVAAPLKARGAALIWASRNRELAANACQSFGGRQIAWEAIYQTHQDILVVAEDSIDEDDSRLEALTIHPGYLRQSITVADLTTELKLTPFQEEAAKRNAYVVKPTQILMHQCLHIARMLGGTPDVAAVRERLANYEQD